MLAYLLFLAVSLNARRYVHRHAISHNVLSIICKALGARSLYINIVDMIQYRQDLEHYEALAVSNALSEHVKPPMRPRRFNNRQKFINYTKKKRFPKTAARENPLLKALLRQIY
jgi:hypothetical protein